MNPTAEPSSDPATTGADRPVVLTLATDPARHAVSFEATIRHPAQFAAAMAAFWRVVAADPPWTRSSLGPGSDRIAQNPDLRPPPPLIRPIVTMAEDAWIIEGFARGQSVYARISVDRGGFSAERNVRTGTTNVRIPPTFNDSLTSIRGGVESGIRLGEVDSARLERDDWPVGWLGGFLGLQAAMSLPMRRVAIDRGGLFGLISTLGGARRVRASRAIVVSWEPGQTAMVQVRPEVRPIRLHPGVIEGGPRGSVRVAVGRHLADLAGLLPWVDSADLFLLGPGLPSCWLVRLGGIRLVLGLPSWTADGRLGRLSLDPVEPPVEPGRFLANQVVATFRNHPTQPREQVVERTRGSVPEVAAVLTRLAGLGRVLPEPESGLFRWRPAFDASVSPLDDPESAEATAARAITRTSSVRITRDEVRPDGRGRRVEALILDRPVTIDLDPDGWLQRGRCTCSHHRADGLNHGGPCRHLLALQAQATPPPRPGPHDLATWFARCEGVRSEGSGA